MFHYANQIKKYMKRYTRYHNCDLDVPQKNYSNFYRLLYLHSLTTYRNPSSENQDPCVFLLQHKFEDDPTVKEFGVWIFTRPHRVVRIWNEEFTFWSYNIVETRYQVNETLYRYPATPHRSNQSASPNK